MTMMMPAEPNVIAIDTGASFQLWREALLHNAGVLDRRSLGKLSEDILRGLWQQGAPPDVRGILRHCTWETEIPETETI